MLAVGGDKCMGIGRRLQLSGWRVGLKEIRQMLRGVPEVAL